MNDKIIMATSKILYHPVCKCGGSILKAAREWYQGVPKPVDNNENSFIVRNYSIIYTWFVTLR